MNKKVICIVGVVLFLALVVGIAVLVFRPKGSIFNDGYGRAEFSDLTYEEGFGLDIDAGDFPIDVRIEKGKLNIKIVKDDQVIFEQTNIDVDQNIITNIPENGYYFMILSGKKATGVLNYEVAESVNTPEIEGIDLDKKLVDEEIVKKTVENNFKKEFGNTIEEIKFNSIKIYTPEEISTDELLQGLNLEEHDIAFEINYELRIKEGTEDMMQFTAATGEIDGQWVKEKYNCGVAKYDAEKDEYSLTNFGTSF